MNFFFEINKVDLDQAFVKQKKNLKEKRASLPDNNIDYIAIDHCKSSSLANLEKERAKFLSKNRLENSCNKNFAANDKPETTEKSR